MAVSIESRFGSDAPYVHFNYSEMWDCLTPESESSNTHYEDCLEVIHTSLAADFKPILAKMKLVAQISKEQDILDADLRQKIEAVKKELYHVKIYIADFFNDLDKIVIEEMSNKIDSPC